MILEKFAAGPPVSLFIEPIQAVAEDLSISAVGPQRIGIVSITAFVRNILTYLRYRRYHLGKNKKYKN